MERERLVSVIERVSDGRMSADGVADLILSELAKEKTASGELVEELREWGKKCGLEIESEIEDMDKAYADFDEILSRHRPVKEESLAELADRKGMRISRIENFLYPVGWLIHLIPKSITGNEPIWQRYDKTVEIPMDDNVDTYSECEAKARAYLMGLPDQKKGGSV